MFSIGHREELFMSRLKKIAVFGVVLATLAALFYAVYKRFFARSNGGE